MANNVFANGREISCKKADGKSICAFPDVCWTPPQTAATPTGVPIPYPNTAYAKDTKKGSKNVKISKKEVMLKNKSYFKKSVGDQAGNAPKKGFVTSKKEGKGYFRSWSPNVKFEGKNVVRHFDLTTQNHGSDPGNVPPWLYKDTDVSGTEDPCETIRNQVTSQCTNKTYKKDQSSSCCEAKKCVLASYGAQPDCCDGKTKHHIVPDHCFKEKGGGGYYPGIANMSYSKGLCVCVSGTDKSDRNQEGELLTHGKIHDAFDRQEDWYRDNKNRQWYFEEANDIAADVVSYYTGCSKECLKQQTSEYYKTKKVHHKTKLRADSNARRGQPQPDSTEMGNTEVAWSIPS